MRKLLWGSVAMLMFGAASVFGDECPRFNGPISVVEINEERNEYVMPPSIDEPPVMPEVIDEETGSVALNERNFDLVCGVVTQVKPVAPSGFGRDEIELLQDPQGNFSARTDCVPYTHIEPVLVGGL